MTMVAIKGLRYAYALYSVLEDVVTQKKITMSQYM